ncbi:MAG: hydroxysqualene dehydroxylase HpnE [Pseudomonadota bacterium]
MSDNIPCTYIVGAGLAGLAAAVRLTEAGRKVQVLESAGNAGGRCRSFHDRTLDRMIDNGNHLIMSGNKSALSFLDRIGSRDPLTGPEFAEYPFVDIASGARWKVRINEGPIPFWVFDKKWRVPGSRVLDYIKAARIALAGPSKTVADVVDKNNILYKNFWEPLTLAVLNTTPQIGQAKLLWAVIRETFALGGQASTPLAAREGLGPAFIDPALAFLLKKNASVRFNARVREARFSGERLTALKVGEEEIPITEQDTVVFAIPPSRLKQLLDGVDPPEDNASILNVHYRTASPIPTAALGRSPFIGMLSSDAHWAFVRDDVVSLTVSASHEVGLDETPNAQVVDALWKETQAALGLGDTPYEAVRVIRERRATPDQSPVSAAKRLDAKTRYKNLFLAGDHTDTGVPATIEGSIRSGDRAAELVLGRAA